MPLFSQVLVPLLVLGFLILVHELGHFLVARRAGMRVHEFAIGFGPPLLSWRRREVLYTLRAILIGGFVRIAGMDPEEDPHIEGGFMTRPVSARLAVLVAGAAMNVLAAVALFCVLGMTFGILDEQTTRVGGVVEGSPAAKAGLQRGDLILGVNGVRYDSADQIREQIAGSPGKPVELLIERGQQRLTITVIPRVEQGIRYDEQQQRAHAIKVGIIGIGFELVLRRAGPWESIKLGFLKALIRTWELLAVLALMITGRAPLVVGGPLAILDQINDQAQLGLYALLDFAGWMSVNLAVLNLLPLPGLDGGRMGFQLVSALLQKVRGRPVDPRKEAVVHTLGILLLLGFILYVTVVDIRRMTGQ